MENKARIFTDDDYPVIFDWLVARHQQVIPRGIIPKLSLIMDMDGVPAAFCSVYLDNSVNVAHLTWITTNPDLKAVDAARAIDLLMGAVEAACRANNYLIMFATTGRKSVGKFLTRNNGFIPIHTCGWEMIKLYK